MELERKEPADSITVVYSEHDDGFGIFCPHCGIEQIENTIDPTQAPVFPTTPQPAAVEETPAATEGGDQK